MLILPLAALAAIVRAQPQLTLNIPLLGSLSPCWGRLTGITNPERYKLCIYLESTATGVSLYNGPKPHEADDSFSPIQPDGTFRYEGWWANSAFDPVTPFIYGFAYPSALGNCVAVLGTPDGVPGAMYTTSIAWVKLPRKSTLFAKTTSLDAAGNAALSFGGLPDTANRFAVLLYSGDRHALTGPLPGCAPSALFTLQQGSGDSGSVLIPYSSWCQGGGCSASTQVTFVLTMAATQVTDVQGTFHGEGIGTAVCVEKAASNQGAPLPPGVLGSTLLWGVLSPPTQSGPAATPPPAWGVGATILGVAVPPLGAVGVATGVVKGVPPAGFKVLSYAAGAGQSVWWGPKGITQMGLDGGFTVAFQTAPQDVASSPSVLLLVVPITFNPAPVQGAALPLSVTSAAVAHTIVLRAWPGESGTVTVAAIAPPVGAVGLVTGNIAGWANAAGADGSPALEVAVFVRFGRSSPCRSSYGHVGNNPVSPTPHRLPAGGGGTDRRDSPSPTAMGGSRFPLSRTRTTLCVRKSLSLSSPQTMPCR